MRTPTPPTIIPPPWRVISLSAESPCVVSGLPMANTDRGRALIASGLANHRRIEIIRLLQSRGSLCVNEVATECRIDVATASQHAKRLHEAGLIKKRAEGRKVQLFPTRRASTLLGTIDLLWESPAD